MHPTQTSDTYDGIIFDFNGVLLWDAHLQEGAWRAMSVEVRGSPLTDDEMIHVVHGRTNRDTLSHLLGRSPDPDELRVLSDRKEDTYRRLCLADREAFQLSPGAITLLEALRLQGTRRTIATSSPRVDVDFFIEHLALGRWFDPRRIVYDDGTFPGKPSPDIYLEAAARLGLSPADCLVVEDALSGIAAARAAGIGRIVALGPTERHADLRAVEGVAAVISRLDELPAQLGRGRGSSS